MSDDLGRLSGYIHEVLDTHVSISPWTGTNRLPVYINHRYHLYNFTLLGVHCVAAIEGHHGHLTPAEIAKHMHFLEAQTELPCIYVHSSVTSFNRKRLIAQGIQFIIPGRQMYVPRVGLDLREHYNQRKPEPHPWLSPAAQVVLLHCLTHFRDASINPAQMAEQLRYTRMTMTRVLDQLTAVELGTVQELGRERWFTFDTQSQALWQKALPLLRTPVKRRIKALKTRETALLGLNAGPTALAHFSMLSEPATQTRAVTSQEAKSLSGFSSELITDTGPNVLEFEIWTYDPRLLTDGKDRNVDRLSLYLSLKDNPDDRVVAALNEMMDTQTW